MAQDREFREDVYYRVERFPDLSAATARKGKADIPELVEYFVQQFAASMDKSIESIPPETMRSLVASPLARQTFESSKNYVARGVILIE